MRCDARPFCQVGFTSSHDRTCWSLGAQEGNYESGKAMKHLARNSHKRYFLLIAFAAYLREGGRESFERWFKSRGELSHLFQNIDI